MGMMLRAILQDTPKYTMLMQGHLDMLMGHPWRHGRCGFLVVALGHVVYIMHLDAVRTHTCHGCIPTSNVNVLSCLKLMPL